MTKTCPETGGSPYPRTNAKHWVGVEAEDIPQGWIDDMVKRLFDVLNRQIIRLEQDQQSESDKKDELGNPPELDLEKAARTSRLLKDMRESLKQLADMETKSRRARKPKATMTDEQTLAELERRLDSLAAENGSGRDRKGSQS
jgi:hypothetical protein